MPYTIITVGASAGGIESLKGLVSELPGNIDAALFVTLHIPAQPLSRLPTILTQAGRLRAFHPQEGQRIRRGCIYVAPPDRHLILHAGLIHLASGPRENGCRPAIDPMFRSAARAYRERVIGIVLSGTLDDGTAGLGAIRAAGGITIAQDPDDAMFGDMPRNAIDAGVVDHVVALRDLGPLVRTLARATPEGGEPGAGLEEPAMADIKEADDISASDNPPQEATDFTCPDCGGVLRVVVGSGTVPHYRCHVGHAWANGSLGAAQIGKIEESLWVSLRALEENRKLMQRMFDDASSRGLAVIAAHYRERLDQLDGHADKIRRVLMQQREQQDEAGTIPPGIHSGRDEMT